MVEVIRYVRARSAESLCGGQTWSSGPQARSDTTERCANNWICHTKGIIRQLALSIGGNLALSYQSIWQRRAPLFDPGCDEVGSWSANESEAQRANSSRDGCSSPMQLSCTPLDGVLLTSTRYHGKNNLPLDHGLSRPVPERGSR